MRDVSIAEFKDNASAFVHAAKGGEEFIITRHGKAMAKLSAIEADGDEARLEEARTVAEREVVRKARQREAVEGLFAAGREHRAKYGSVSTEQIVEWINEDQR